MRGVVLTAWAVCTFFLVSCARDAPEPVTQTGSDWRVQAKPLQQLQQEFLDLRFGMFIHFNMSTYQEVEWGVPTASPEVFNPVKLDCKQWAKAAKSANMTYACLTTRHHDGFSIWPTKTTDHSIANSPVQRDVVKEYADAFRAEGLKVMLYYSILDMHHDVRPRFVTREKVDYIKAQLTELLTNYGEISAIVFDGWDAGWARLTYDDVPFDEIYHHIKSIQPNCLVIEHNAAKYPVSGLFYTDAKHYEQNAGQTIGLANVVPAQSGPCIQSEWFWKTSFPTEEMKSVESIVDVWLKPFNEAHCNLLLNVAINRDGLIDQNALDRLAEIGEVWQHPGPAPKLPELDLPILTRNLAIGHKSYVSSYFASHGPDQANDDNFRTDWTCGKYQMDGWIEIDLGQPVTFNTAAFSEPRSGNRYGEDSRIQSYKIQYKNGENWVDIATGGVPSATQIESFAPVTAQRVRLTIICASDMPAINEFGLYNE